MTTARTRLICATCFVTALWSQTPQAAELLARFKARSLEAEQKGLADAFVGIRTSQGVEKGLFAIRSTGVSTDPVRKAADSFLTSLTEDQRSRTLFPVDDPEWRKWMNQHFYVRQGTYFKDMSEVQKEAAFKLMQESLSAKGLKLSRDIMRLNHTLGELNHNDFVQYGEFQYAISVMGKPSKTEPWGWQLDGHHLIINYFVLGDQVVMTPSFFGSEPTRADSGKFKGTVILTDEQTNALKLINTLDEGQRSKAIIQMKKTGNNILAQAYSDNVVLDYAGIKATDLSPAQRDQLINLIALWINNTREGHARIRMDEIEKHMDRTYFAWIGDTGENAVFYYRIHSPVVLIEFDHETPVGLRHLYQPNIPFREHVHAVIRTPNGNDYGKDLLRLHYQQHAHN